MAAPITAVTMPKWGIEMTEGTITGWRIAEGQPVKRGSEILDVETEKIVNAVEAPASGVLRKILAGEGDTQAVGTLIGIIADEAVSEADIAAFVKSFVAAVVSFDEETPPAAGAAASIVGMASPAASTSLPGVSAAQSAAGAAGPATSVSGATASAARPAAESSGLVPAAEAAANSGDEARVSPIARRVAERLGVDLARVKGTGRNGRISKEDVEAFAARGDGAAGPEEDGEGAVAADGEGAAAEGAAVPVQAGDHGASPLGSSGEADAANPAKRVRMSARRGVIARRLLESTRSVPHYRLAVDVDFGPLRHRRRESAQGGGEAASLNDWLLRAVALALVRHPDVNAQLDGDDILQFANADIAIAVAGEAGLVTPILRAANSKRVGVIAQESRDLIERARAGTLRREEITGGSFTVSNLGMYGVKSFDAIINPPQVAILAVGAIEKRAVVRGDALAIAEMGTLTLSADHRVVDGAMGAAFLKDLVKSIEEPDGLES